MKATFKERNLQMINDLLKRSACLCLLLALAIPELSWAKPKHHQPYQFDLGASFQESIETKDRKRAFVLSFDPYANEQEQISRKDALRRLRKFANTYIADRIKEETTVLEKTLVSKDPEQTAQTAANEDGFHYEMRYRIRGRRAQMDFVSNLIDISGVAEIGGRPRMEAKKFFGDLSCKYVYFLDKQDQRFIFEKPLTAYIRATTSLGISSSEREADSEFQLRFDSPF